MRTSSAAAWLPTPPPAMAIPKKRQKREEKYKEKIGIEKIRREKRVREENETRREQKGGEKTK